MTPKREKFAQEIVQGRSQSDAYRVAFKPKRASAKTVYEKASRLMAHPKVTTRVKELMAPLVAEAQLTREQWIEDSIRLYRGDVRKLFDEHGNPIDIPNLADSEADLIESFEVVEDFTKVKKNQSGEEQAVATGYTKKYRLTSKLARHKYVGQALGYLATEKDGDDLLTLAKLVSMIVTKADRKALAQKPTVVNG